MADDPTTYLKAAELRAAIEPAGTWTEAEDNQLYQLAISSSSRLLDEWCYGEDGHFWQTNLEPRLFVADTDEWCCVDDFDTTDDMLVESDNDFDGVFETAWTVTDDWIGYPYVRVNNRPYRKIMAVGEKRFPVGSRRPGLQVTARWGWGTIPAPVKEACLILSVVSYKAKDFVDLSESDMDSVDLAKKLVKPYVRPGGRLWGMDQQQRGYQR